MIIENDLGTMILHGINLGMSLIRGIEKLEGRHPLKLMIIIEVHLETIILRGINLGRNLHGISLGTSLLRGIEKLEGRHLLKLMIIIEIGTIILRGINLGKILPRVMRRLKSCYRNPMLKDRITCSVEFRGIVLRQNVFRPK